MKFDSFGGVKQETNLQGLHINCSTLSWSPWFKLTNCKGSSNTDCSGVGYLADAMNFLSVRFNFTWSCDTQPNRHWGGQQPISGPKNASGSWGRVVGNVVNGTYPLCISVWHHMDWRHEMLDYAFMGTGRKFVIAYLPSSTSYDIWLFIKPFRHDTWLCIAVGSLLMIPTMFYGYRYERKFHQQNGKKDKLAGIKLLFIIGWLFFIVTLNGFYDGALTMFFADETPADFDSELELLKAYPEWIYNIKKSSFPVGYGSSDRNEEEKYKKFHELKTKDPDKFYFKNAKEGIKRMKSGKVGVRLEDNSLRQYLKEHPKEPRPNIIMIDQKQPNADNIILTKNSPLALLFKTGSIELWETGLMKILEVKWFGKELEKKTPNPLHTVVLNLGQTSMMFLIMGVAIIGSLILLGMELLWDCLTTNKPATPVPIPLNSSIADLWIE